MNLLLVDDEVIEIEALEVSIPWKQMGFSCIFHSYNIKEAKKILTTQDIHLMISDIEMPHGSSLELLKWTRENCPHVVCILFTCHADFSYAKQAVHSQAFDYLLKPINPVEIECVVKRAIQKMNLSHVNTAAAENGPDSAATAIDKVIKYIKNHPSENPSREKLAEIVHLNPDYLSRLFRKQTGATLSDYITATKMETAKRLLLESHQNIGRIAADLGYTNFSYFSKKFREHTGVSPMEFRNYL